MVLIDNRNEPNIKAAVIEDGRLVEYIVSDERNKSFAGNVYIGLVKNTTKSGFVFADAGIGQNVFVQDAVAARTGDKIMVQILKDAEGEKGCFATTEPSFTGKSVVLKKSGYRTVTVSKKIEDKSQRARLRALVSERLPEGFTAIVRTDAALRTDGEIIDELKRLTGIYEQCVINMQSSAAPKLLYGRGFIDGLLEEIGGCEVKYENEAGTVFYAYNVERDVKRALVKKVWLPSGAFLVIERTEAAWVVDVNSGRFGGKRNADSALQVNLEAAEETARQIRLRNDSGIILVDFIDMEREDSKGVLIKRIEEELKKDRIGAAFHGLTKLGLAEITRKKSRISLSEALRGGKNGLV